MIEGLEADARVLGLVLEGFDEEDEDDGIWPENEAALTAFLRVQTQWRWISPGDGRSHRVGLDYPGVKEALRWAKIKVTPDLFGELQLIEVGVINADREESDW